jgi:hypothetical protein
VARRQHPTSGEFVTFWVLIRIQQEEKDNCRSWQSKFEPFFWDNSHRDMEHQNY